MKNSTPKFNIDDFCKKHHITPQSFKQAFEDVYQPLCLRLFNEYNNYLKKPLIVGINGSQGSGKSTLVELLAEMLENEHGLHVAVLSIDDLYKTRAERQKMGREIHPLFSTRGVPGTHDIELGLNVFNELQNATNDAQTLIPRFDKASDDRHKKEQWQEFTGKPDIILFEGWCVGAKAQNIKALEAPINALEEKQDKHKSWRSKANTELQERYNKIFNLIDFFIFLKAPNFKCVYNWRKEQEHKLIDTLKANNKSFGRTMSDPEIEHFMMFYERLTRHNIETLSDHADITILLDKNRKPVFKA